MYKIIFIILVCLSCNTAKKTERTLLNSGKIAESYNSRRLYVLDNQKYIPGKVFIKRDTLKLKDYQYITETVRQTDTVINAKECTELLFTLEAVKNKLSKEEALRQAEQEQTAFFKKLFINTLIVSLSVFVLLVIISRLKFF